LCRNGGTWQNGPSPIDGFRLVAVQAVKSTEPQRLAFADKQAELMHRREVSGEAFAFDYNTLNAEKLHVLSIVRDQFLETVPGVNPKAGRIFYCFHGTNPNNIEGICRDGLRLSQYGDKGYGGYATLNLEYAIRYARGDFSWGDRRTGRLPAIMLATVASKVYPITPDTDYGRNYNVPAGESDYSRLPLRDGFDCHVACVNGDVGFPAAVNPDQCQYMDVIVEQSSQVLPVAVLWFEEL
jgi:hypothetical protein